MVEYYECRYCGQVVQGFEAAMWLPQPCNWRGDHKWSRVLPDKHEYFCAYCGAEHDGEHECPEEGMVRIG